MNRRTIILGMAMIVCIGALMVAPAVAVQGFAKQGSGDGPSLIEAGTNQKLEHMASSEQTRNQNTHRMKVAACIKNCPDDVWAIISEHRLSIFDLRVNTAESLITLYEEKGFDVTEAVATLDEIKENRDDLSAALQSRDKDEIKSVYQEVSSLWKDLRKQFWGWLKNTCSPDDESTG